MLEKHWTDYPSDSGKEAQRQKNLLNPSSWYEVFPEKLGSFLGFVLAMVLVSLLIGICVLAQGIFKLNKKILSLVATLVSFLVILAIAGIIVRYEILKILFMSLILSAYLLGIPKYIKSFMEIRENERLEKAFLATSLRDSLGYIPKILRRSNE